MVGCEILSGYLISSIILAQLRKGKFSFIDFYARRVKRIFPALLLMLALFLIMPGLSSAISLLIPVSAAVAILAARYLYKKGLV